MASARPPWRPSKPLSKSEREACSAAAGCRGLRVVDAEGRADQVVDEIDLGTGQVAHRDLIDQHGRALAPDDDIVVRLGAVDVEPVLEAGAAAALRAHAEHAAGRLAAQNLADAA